MESEDTLMLNLNTQSNTDPAHRRARLTKKDRIQKKRLERRQRDLALNIEASKSSLKGEQRPSVAADDTANKPITKDHRVKPQQAKPGTTKSSLKRKRDDLSDTEDNERADTAKHFKSILFYNNPEIPKIESSNVETVTEKVFSGDNFNELDLHPFMVSNLEQTMGVSEATSVQKATIPKVLSGKDVLVKSQTGSGKTLAYAIPIVQELQALRPKLSRSDGAHALVIVPTRELALQTLAIFQKLIKPFTWIVPGCLMGGEKKKSEKARLRKGLNILVSTPGRLTDHLEHTKNLDVARIKWLVIDEADRLMDMGFEKDVSQVVNALKERGPKDRQTLLLSATLSTGVERLAGMSLQSPVRVDITSNSSLTSSLASPGGSQFASTTEKVATPENLKHHCIIVPSKLRLVTLAAFILWKCKMAVKRSKMLVFMSTQDAVDFHYRLFSKTLFESDEDAESEGEEEAESKKADSLLFRLHGEMAQKDRTKIFSEFAKAESGVLFCTDVAARGLDLPQVRWIVQYMPPGGSTDYIHRVGRTARIGSRGNALLFLTPAEANFTKLLANSSISVIEVEMNDILKTLLVEKDKLDYLWQDNDPPHTIQEAASLVQVRFTEHVRINRESRTLARKAYQSFTGAYAAYPGSVKNIFHVKNLHLGHTATSFGLQEAPSKIGNIVGTQLKKQNAATAKKGKPERRRGSLPSSMHTSNASEFSSGFGKAKNLQSTKFTRKAMRRLNAKKSKST